MQLGDILIVLNESTRVNVRDAGTSEVISCYDGKDSIDENLFDREVVLIDLDAYYDTLAIYVKEK